MSFLKGRILYSEDNPESRDLLMFMLQRVGYEVICCENGFEALRLAQSERFDLFLLDNWMPDLTGIELTKQIRKFNLTTPILFYSAAAYDRDKACALDAGAQAYLIKPDGLDNLVDEVERLIAEAGMQAEIPLCPESP